MHFFPLLIGKTSSSMHPYWNSKFLRSMVFPFPMEKKKKEFCIHATAVCQSLATAFSKNSDHTWPHLPFHNSSCDQTQLKLSYIWVFLNMSSFLFFFFFFFFFSPCALSMQILRRSYTHSAHMGCACAEILDLPHEVIVRGVRRRVAVLAQWMLLNTRANWSAWEILSKIQSFGDF